MLQRNALLVLQQQEALFRKGSSDSVSPPVQVCGSRRGLSFPAKKPRSSKSCHQMLHKRRIKRVVHPRVANRFQEMRHWLGRHKKWRKVATLTGGKGIISAAGTICRPLIRILTPRFRWMRIVTGFTCSYFGRVEAKKKKSVRHLAHIIGGQEGGRTTHCCGNRRGARVAFLPLCVNRKNQLGKSV